MSGDSDSRPVTTRNQPLVSYKEDPAVPGAPLVVTAKQAWADRHDARLAQAQMVGRMMWEDDELTICAVKLLPDGVELVCAVPREADVDAFRASMQQALIDWMSVF